MVVIPIYVLWVCFCGCVFVCVDFLVVYCILRVGRYPQCKLLNLFQVNCFIQRQYHKCPYIENVFFCDFKSTV